MVFLTFVDRITQGLRLLGALALIFMALSVFYDTMMRYLFLSPTAWSLEVNSYLIVFIALIPAGSILRGRQHLRIGLIHDKMSPTIGKVVQSLINLIGVACCGTIAVKGVSIAYTAWLYDERMSTVFGTPLVIPYSFIPIGFGVLALVFIANLAEDIIDDKFNESA